MRDERYLEDDDRLHRKLIISCELITEPEQAPDDEDTQALLLRERLLAT